MNAPSLTLPLPAPLASPLRYAVVGVLFSLVWSSAFIAGKVGLAVAGPLTLLSLRFLLAGALLWVALLLAGHRLRPVPPVMVLAGLLNNAVYLGLAYSGLAQVPAALTAILVCTAPLVTVLLAAAIHGERLTGRAVAGLCLAFASVVTVMGQRLHVDGLNPWAVGAIALGSLALAVGTLLTRRISGGGDPWSTTLAQLLAGGLALLPLAWAREGLAFEAGSAFYGSLLYQAGPVSIGTTLMLLWLVRHGGAPRASSFHLLNPFFSIALAVFLLGETLRPLDLACLVPLAAGLTLALHRPR